MVYEVLGFQKPLHHVNMVSKGTLKKIIDNSIITEETRANKCEQKDPLWRLVKDKQALPLTTQDSASDIVLYN